MNDIEKIRFWDRMFYITGYGLIGCFVLLGFVIGNMSLEGLIQLFPFMLILGVLGLISSAHSLNLYRQYKKSFGDSTEGHY